MQPEPTSVVELRERPGTVIELASGEAVVGPDFCEYVPQMGFGLRFGTRAERGRSEDSVHYCGGSMMDSICLVVSSC